MRVRAFGGGMEELGAVRDQVEWNTVKRFLEDNDCIDPDTVTDTQIEVDLTKTPPSSERERFFNNTSLLLGRSDR